MAGVYPIRGDGQKGGKPIIRDVAPVTDLLNMRSSGYVTRLTLFRHGSDRRALHKQRKTEIYSSMLLCHSKYTRIEKQLSQ